MSANSQKKSGPESPAALRREVDWLLTDIAWVVTCDDAMRCIPGGAIAIEGNTLAAVGPSNEIQLRFKGRKRMDLSGFLVAPGLVNTHGHAAMSCFRGLGDDLPLDRWLSEVIFPAEASSVTPELVYFGTLLSCIEMLKGGTTTFCDGYFFEEEAVRAADASGIRGVLGQGILDFPAPDQPDPKRSRERAEGFLGSFPSNGGRLRPSLFCHSAYTCGPETLKWAKSLCRERDLLFQIHVSETSSEVDEVERKYGLRPVRHLDGLGVLDEMTLCAHVVWPDPGEIAILGARSAGVTHVAESNMKLASGVAPVQELAGAGIRIGLGTDGCASNNDLDMFSEMDKVAKTHKVFYNDPILCSASEVLAMATRGGASVLGWRDKIGSIRGGGNADIIAIDLNQPHLTPLYDPISHMVYCAGPGDVRHVWVDGRQVVSEGKILTVDEMAVMKEVTKIAGRIREKIGTP